MDRCRHLGALEVNPATVAHIRQRYVAAGLEAAIDRKPPARQYRRRLDGQQEARLVALTCSAPPRATSAGRCGCWPTGWWNSRWWSRCRMRRSARPCSKPAQAMADQRWCIPPEQDGEVLLADGGRAGGLHPAL
jgi:hypothetical protein